MLLWFEIVALKTFENIQKSNGCNRVPCYENCKSLFYSLLSTENIHCRYFSGVAVGVFNGVLKILENVLEKLCYGVPLSKLQVFRLQHLALPSMFVKFWKIPEKMCAVEFIFTEAGAIRFSTRDLSTQF